MKWFSYVVNTNSFTDLHAVVTPTVYDGRLVYDKNVKIGENAKVLDAGTGIGARIRLPFAESG